MKISLTTSTELVAEVGHELSKLITSGKGHKYVKEITHVSTQKQNKLICGDTKTLLNMTVREFFSLVEILKFNLLLEKSHADHC